jgi:hypothetical protein
MGRLNRGTTDFMARQTVTPKKKRGPSPTGKGTPITVRLQPSNLAMVDDWASQQDDQPSRPEAIRRMIEQVLKKKR